MIDAPPRGSEIGERVQCFIVQEHDQGNDNQERKHGDGAEQKGERAVALLRLSGRAGSRERRCSWRGVSASLGVGSNRRRRSPL
ncbi:MAG: hypothetical protein WAV02_03665, partial [Stellaceae bacterium]